MIPLEVQPVPGTINQLVDCREVFGGVSQNCASCSREPSSFLFHSREDLNTAFGW